MVLGTSGVLSGDWRLNFLQ